MTYRVLLYYKFVHLADPQEFADRQLQLCRLLGLKGRIIIAEEGLNGTVSGPRDKTDLYMAAVRAHPLFSDIQFKIDEVNEHAFRRLSVKVRDEIVTLGLPAVKAYEKTGEHLSPPEFLRAMEEEDVLLVDGRNDYEYDLGHFRGAVRPPLETFKEFPEWIDRELAGNQDRKILTYCTGGIRCEKLTALLMDKGFTNVYQLHGGIVEYGKHPETRGKLFDGQCFVFDDRIAVEVNSAGDKQVVGKCYHCGEACEIYVNCANVECNRLYLSCDDCTASTERCCSEACKSADRHRAAGQKL